MINKFLSPHKKSIGVCLFVLFLFTAGFFIQYGREARASGSWKYVIIHLDEYFYWTYAQAHAQAPERGPNPFFFEERASFHLPPYPVTNGVGFLARLLNVHVLFFFPLWHIGAPFLVWFALFFSARRFWKYPLMPSAAVSLILCLITLPLKGLYPWILTRFSRPADFLWAMILCVSLIMTSRKPGKGSFLILNLFAAFSIWMSPLFAVTGLVVIIPEILWGAFVEKNKKRALWLGSSLGSFCVSSWIYSLYVQGARTASKSSWFLTLTTPHAPSFTGAVLPSLILFALIAGMALGLHFYKKHTLAKDMGPASLSPLERLTFYVFALEPLFVLAFVIFPNGAFFEMERHRYINFLIQFAVLSAWAWESFQLIKDTPVLNKVFRPLIATLSLITGILLFFPKTNFLLQELEKDLAFVQENAVMLLSLICPLFLIILLIGKYSTLKNIVQKRAFVALLSMALCFSGFALYPSGMRLYNEKFPFGGAYAWLKKNAGPDEVVLTPSTFFSQFDYLLFYTGLRSYSSHYGEWYAANPEASMYRRLFILSLINGVLYQTPLQGLNTLVEKIGHLRMDYVLIPRWSPFKEDVERQLAGHLTRVYEDKKAVLWKISAQPL